MMNGSAIRTGACLHWNENPRTSALRDIGTADLYRRRMCLERRGSTWRNQAILSTSVIEELISLDCCDQVQALNNIAAVELI